jgi:hypothetical protein
VFRAGLDLQAICPQEGHSITSLTTLSLSQCARGRGAVPMQIFVPFARRAALFCGWGTASKDSVPARGTGEEGAAGIIASPALRPVWRG